MLRIAARHTFAPRAQERVIPTQPINQDQNTVTQISLSFSTVADSTAYSVKTLHTNKSAKKKWLVLISFYLLSKIIREYHVFAISGDHQSHNYPS